MRYLGGLLLLSLVLENQFKTSHWVSILGRISKHRFLMIMENGNIFRYHQHCSYTEYITIALTSRTRNTSILHVSLTSLVVIITLRARLSVAIRRTVGPCRTWYSGGGSFRTFPSNWTRLEGSLGISVVLVGRSLS